MSIQTEVFWAVMLSSVTVGYLCFGGPCCLLFQGDDGLHCLHFHGVTTQKTLNQIFTIMKTSKLA